MVQNHHNTRVCGHLFLAVWKRLHVVIMATRVPRPTLAPDDDHGLSSMADRCDGVRMLRERARPVAGSGAHHLQLLEVVFLFAGRYLPTAIIGESLRPSQGLQQTASWFRLCGVRLSSSANFVRICIRNMSQLPM